MIKRTAVVHIGLEKTGSTAIQRWLAANQQALQANGILMPRSIGFPNHTRLVSACLDDGVVDNIKKHHLFACGLPERLFRRAVFADLAKEVRLADPSWRTLLITSELISSRLSSVSELERLVTQIGQYVDHIRFVVFLRRQDQLALSRFSSILRSGHGEFHHLYVDYSPFNFLSIPDDRPISDDLFFYDFEAILSRFEALPGSELAVYFYGQDRPIEVFQQLLNLNSPSQADGTVKHNSALSAKAQFILAHLNRRCPVQFPSGMRNDVYRQLQRRVEREVMGEPRVVARQAAADFLGRYSAANQRVFNRYVRSDRQSFSDDVSAYPVLCDYSDLPGLVMDQLRSYEMEAEHLPVVEPLAAHFQYKARRFKKALKGLLTSPVRP